MYRLTGPGVKPPAYTAARRPPVDNLDGRARKRRRATSDPNCHPHAWSRRVQVPEPAPPPTLVHDPEFWFEDGSVVLVSLNTGFRVYKRLLVEHSPFFRDLFQMPQPANAPTVEGTPCVVVSDPPEQVRHLLRVLFPTNGHLAFSKREEPYSMDAVAAIVRLSHKYQIDHLLAQGLALLMEQYTDDFEAWKTPGRALPIAARDVDAITAINIAHLTNTPSLLPLAFLAVSRAGTNMLRGCVRDGRGIERLAFPDIERVLNGRVAWCESSSKAIARVFAPDNASAGCPERRRCMRILATKASDLDDVLERMYRSDVVYTWTDEFDEEDEDTGHKLCDSCRDMIDARELEERKWLWDELPAMFNLTVEGWSVR
ncbi:hypothetical protein TRAPUB_2145 [Trametes pubescens]|uniref:BTB domain-containing protein n=1 Tax=Trametes pubescens TaxID=154538 RepID=A0A1M2VHD6_TRAPU|nr:hypothetical protein TRAPUB_2145 [Trametes pubescens]